MAKATGYKVKQWKNTTYYGKAAVSKNFAGGVYAFTDKGEFVELYRYATKGAVYGVAGGRGVEMSNGVTYYLITLKTKYQTYEYAYVSLQDFNFSAARAQDEKEAKEGAQALLNNLISNDKKVYMQIIAQQILLEKAKAKGIDTTEGNKKLLEIAAAFGRRQFALKTNPDLQIINFFKLNGIGCKCNDGVGVLPLLVPVAIGAGIVLVGFVMYYFLKPEFNASQLHSEYLAKNEEELKKKLGPVAYAELQKNVDKEIKEAAQSAYDDGKSETTFGLIKNVGLMAAGFYLLTKFQSSKAAK